MRHGAAIYTTGRMGCWWTCLCGAKADDLRRGGRGASLSWAEHVAANPIPTNPPREEFDMNTADIEQDERTHR